MPYATSLALGDGGDFELRTHIYGQDDTAGAYDVETCASGHWSQEGDVITLAIEESDDGMLAPGSTVRAYADSTGTLRLGTQRMKPASGN